MTLSIIIPVYEDREACLEIAPRLLEFGEVIVVDASQGDLFTPGSLPETIKFIRSEKAQRAYQMNLGASQAVGEVLLFLHADTYVPDKSFYALGEVVKNLEVVGGGFSRRFASDSILLKVTSKLADWRGKVYGLFLGDQAIFVRRSVFVKVGGFHSLKLFEDFDLCDRLAEEGVLRCVEVPIISSARRFQNGIVSRVWRDFLLTVKYHLQGKDGYLEE